MTRRRAAPRLAGRRPAATVEQYRRIVEVRDARRAIPTDKELARELGLPVYTITNLMCGKGARKLELELARTAP